MRRLLPAALLAGAALLAAAPADGATARFSSPNGKGTACSQMQPCDIVTAVEKAGPGDDITIGTGTYGSPTPVSKELEDEGKTLTIHGEAGQPRPVIFTQAVYGFLLDGDGSSLSDVDIESSVGEYGVAVSLGTSVSIDHVISHVSAPGAIACYPDGTLTDSVCWSSGANGVAATLLVPASSTATLRNDTLIASGSGGTGVKASGFTSGTMTINLVNSIARGAGTDLFAETDSQPKSTAIIDAVHSNYATVKLENGGGGSTTAVTPAGSGTNQTGAPQFVDPAAGDFHELASSTATIDLGEDSPLDGATDLDGNQRALPGHLECGSSPASVTDIGAFEYVPVAPSCTPKIVKAKIDRKAHRATFSFQATGAGSGFQCRLQRAAIKKRHEKRPKPAFAACKSPKTYKHLRPGRYRFEVRALGPGAAPSAAAARTFKLKPPPRSH